MPATSPAVEVTGGDLFAQWLAQPAIRSRRRGHRPPVTAGGVRFALYGRTSTGRFQDPVSSQAWQTDMASRLIAGRGRITATFFDVGASRRVAWQHRPQAAALLAAARDPGRTFDAVVVGEFERAFDADQAELVIAQLRACGVAVWIAEFGGPVDLTDPVHQALLLLLGHQARREVLRCRWRTTTAMHAQATVQGRHLGGRPPYGYRLVDAGPHPNVQHARWGRRLHRLDPDPVTAPVVRWIFTQRLAGASAAGIARTLNAGGVPSPAANDPVRNPHRHHTMWTVRTIAAILANPRDTGRQVWNRQRTDHGETIAGDKRTSTGTTRAWNPRHVWAVSAQTVHPALISEADFRAAQVITAAAQPQDGSVRRYQFTGLLVCGVCGRRLQPHWVHGHPGYRCRHGQTSAHHPTDHPPWIYWSERNIVRQLAATGQIPAEVTSEVEYLRTRDAVVVCTTAALTIDDPASATDVVPVPAIQSAQPSGTVRASQGNGPTPPLEVISTSTQLPADVEACQARPRPPPDIHQG